MKRLQEETLPPKAIYIQHAIEIPNLEGINTTTNPYAFDGDDTTEDLDPENDLSTLFRMVVCMFREASFRLHSTQYLQSDIGFKRVIGFKEFELGGLDSKSRTSKSLLLLLITWTSTTEISLRRYDILSSLREPTDSGCPLHYL